MKEIPDNPHRNHNNDVMLIEKLEAEIEKLKEDNAELFEMLKNTYAFVRSSKILKINRMWIKKHSQILAKLEGRECVFRVEDAIHEVNK